MKRFIAFVWIVLIGVAGFAQGKNYELSAAIDISSKGWNKILQMPHGNTLLFHFENKAGVQVKVFDKAHKEIASIYHKGSIVNLGALENSFFDGLYEIGGDAVLFITQRSNDAESMYRLRFDAQTGKLLSEVNVSESAGFEKNTTAFVLKEDSEKDYYIVAFSKSTIADANITLHAFGDNHEHLKQIPLGTVKKGYDYIHLLSQGIDNTGSILITTELDKIIQYPDVVEKYIVLYYLPKGEEKFNAQVLKMPRGSKDFSVHYSDNTYASTINVFLSSLLQQHATGTQDAQVFFNQLMLVADKEMNTLNQVELKNKKITEYLKNKTKSDAAYAGNVLHVNTNNKGNTTVINEDLLSKTDNNDKNAAYIGITEYDYEGNEKWGAVVPKTQVRNPEYDQPLSEVFKVRTSAYELSQVLCFSSHQNSYIVYNDVDANFDKQLGARFESIEDYSKTNTVYYRLNKKKEFNKYYLFGEPLQGEYKYIYTHSGHFNTRKKLYATLMQYSKGGNTTTHIAWCKIDN